MANKELRATVKLDTSKAESNLGRLAQKINAVNRAVTSAQKVDNGVGKTIAQYDKLGLAARRVAVQEGKLDLARQTAASKQQALIAQQEAATHRMAISAQVAEAKINADKEKNAIAERTRQDTAAYRAERMAARKAEQEARAAKQAEQAAKRLAERKLAEEKRAAAAMQKMARQTEKLRQKETERRINAELRAERKKLEQQKKLNKELGDSVLSSVKGALAALGGILSVKVAVETADMITSAENKLNNINGGDTNATQKQMDAMYGAAQRSRMAYGDMMANVSKSMTLSPDAFQGDIDNAIRFQEIMAKTYTLGGASAAEQSSSMYQLIQGLGSGILQGDELRSVREGAPLAYKAIEEFAQGIYGAETNLKDLASQGKITSDIVVAAIMKSGGAVDTAFADTNMTFAQVWTNIKNIATKAFEPALQKLTQALNAFVENGGLNALIFGFNVLAKVVEGVAIVLNWAAENWSWLQWIVYGLAIAIGLLTTFVIAYCVAIKVVSIWQMITGFVATMMGNKIAMAWLKALGPIALIIAAIGVVIAILNALGISFSDVCGFIVGVVMWALSVIWNVVVGVINALIQSFWANFVTPIAGLIEWLVNAFGGGFDNISDAFLNLLGQMVSMVLSFAKIFGAVIDAIFGTSINDKLGEWQSIAKSWGKNENAVTYSVEAPQLQRLDNTDAYAYGKKLGTSFGDWASEGIDNFGSKLTDPAAYVGKDYTIPTNDELLKGVGDTADNTDKIADDMELSKEDLDYLKKVAEMEWKKEYTTASIKIDMTNNNTINDANDWDGWITKLSNVLTEELSTQAQGVYSY